MLEIQNNTTQQSKEVERLEESSRWQKDYVLQDFTILHTASINTGTSTQIEPKEDQIGKDAWGQQWQLEKHAWDQQWQAAQKMQAVNPGWNKSGGPVWGTQETIPAGCGVETQGSSLDTRIALESCTDPWTITPKHERKAIQGPPQKKNPTRLGWGPGATKKKPTRLAPPFVPRWSAFVIGGAIFAAAGRQWVVPALRQSRNPPQRNPLFREGFCSGG